MAVLSFTIIGVAKGPAWTGMVMADPPSSIPAAGAAVTEGVSNSFQYERRQQALERGVRWLVQQQSSDGSWRSRTYGKMRPGGGNTALILYAISQLPPTTRDGLREPFQAGVLFLTQEVDKHGQIHFSRQTVDYPIYTQALLASAISRFPLKEPAAELPARLSSVLLREQRTSANGWSLESIDRGGWGAWMSPPSAAASETPANISATMYVLEALQLTHSLTSAAKGEALSFLARCGQLDETGDATGGFVFTPLADSPLNKGGQEKNQAGHLQPRPYHSTTCDGIAALHALGLPQTDVRFTSVMTALTLLDPPQLIQPEPNEEQEIPQTAALFFYDAAALSRVWQLTHDPRLTGQRATMLRTLLEHQHPDGSWSNPIPWFHEDDPLIATALAVAALQTF